LIGTCTQFMPASLPESRSTEAIRALAMKFPGVSEGISCNKCAFKAGGKAFLFMGMDGDSWNLMLKLKDSLPEATRLAANEPNRYGVGGHSWVSLTFAHGESPPGGLLERWMEESFRLLVPKKIVALLPQTGPDSKKRSVKALKKGNSGSRAGK
jgi:hypothetical protein